MFKKRAILAILVAIIITGTTTFGTVTYLDRRQYKINLQNQYQRNLYDLVADVESLQVSLSKVPVAASSRRSILLLGDVWKDAGTAQSRINALPITHSAVFQTSKFLSQLGDFSYSLMQSANRGETISASDLKNVAQLKDYAGYLSMQLHQLEQDLADGRMKLEDIVYEGNRRLQNEAQNPVESQFYTISQDMQQYPTLIYDGPFAENMLNIKPKILSQPSISLDKAKETASSILDREKISNIGIYSDKSGERIPVYSLDVKMKGRKGGDIYIDISKNGGMVVYMLDSRNVANAKINVKDAINIGMKFLQKNGYPGMIPTYSLRYDNVAVINYAYVQNKVVIYPDQIKLKVALDNGEIVGIESQHYLVSHALRDIAAPRITVKEAMKNISKNLTVKNARMSIIPLESTREVLCYEFYGTYDGEKYIVYINAMDGNEEKILKLLETPNGELTM